MIPLHDDVPTRRFAVVTLVVILLNVAVFAFELTLPRYGMTLGGFYAKAGATPFELAHGLDVPPGDIVPWWATLFTSMFVHGGWLHLIFNMLYLSIFGANVEDALGRARFLGLYLACGLVAIATQVLTDPGSTAPVIGASGAVAGVLGAYLVLYPHARAPSVFALGFIFPVVAAPAWILLGIWFALQAVEGVLSLRHPAVGVAFFAHVGGFLTGMGLGFVLARRPRRRAPRRV
ncbi:MAG: rhomboid family intramembrane serine protease [Actinomycetes bacterium]